MSGSTFSWIMIVVYAMMVALTARHSQAAEPVVTTQELGPLFVRIETPHGVIGLSETARFSIIVRAPERVAVKAASLAPSTSLGTWEVVTFGKKGQDQFPGKFGTITLFKWTLELEPLAEGNAAPEPLHLEYRDTDDGEWTGVDVLLPAVEVRAKFVRDAEISALKPVPELPGITDNTPTRKSWPRLLRWAGIGLFCCTMVLAALWWWKSGLDPLNEAQKKLVQIESGPSRSHRDDISRASEVVRTYLVKRYQVPAGHRSTQELLAGPELNGNLGESQQLALRDFLREADDERFAKHEPTREDRLRCLQRAKAFLSGESSA